VHYRNIQSRQQKKVRRSDWFRYKVANKMRNDIDTMGLNLQAEPPRSLVPRERPSFTLEIALD
jgi:hypothetical protein